MGNQETLWIRCPICIAKTRTKVYPDTVLVNFPLYCPKCKKEILINLAQLKMTVSEEKSHNSRVCFFRSPRRNRPYLMLSQLLPHCVRQKAPLVLQESTLQHLVRCMNQPKF